LSSDPPQKPLFYPQSNLPLSLFLFLAFTTLSLFFFLLIAFFFSQDGKNVGLIRLFFHRWRPAFFFFRSSPPFHVWSFFCLVVEVQSLGARAFAYFLVYNGAFFCRRSPPAVPYVLSPAPPFSTSPQTCRFDIPHQTPTHGVVFFAPAEFVPYSQVPLTSLASLPIPSFSANSLNRGIYPTNFFYQVLIVLSSLSWMLFRCHVFPSGRFFHSSFFLCGPPRSFIDAFYFPWFHSGRDPPKFSLVQPRPFVFAGRLRQPPHPLVGSWAVFPFSQSEWTP